MVTTVNAFDPVAGNITNGLGEMEKKMNMNDFSGIDSHKLTLIPPFDHKEPVEDDCGLSEHPIFSNYSKYLWTSHKRTGGAEVPDTSSKQIIR